MSTTAHVSSWFDDHFTSTSSCSLGEEGRGGGGGEGDRQGLVKVYRNELYPHVHT